MKVLVNDYCRSRSSGRRSMLDLERGAILAILGMLALGSYSAESEGADVRRHMTLAPVIKGSLATASEPAEAAEPSKVAIVVRPLDLKSLTSDAFDDGQAEPVNAANAKTLR